MGILDHLGSLSIAAGEELPGITQRATAASVKKVNAVAGADFEQARVAGDVEGMTEVMNKAIAGDYNIGNEPPSPEVINVMSEGITGFENDEHTKTMKLYTDAISLNPDDAEPQLQKWLSIQRALGNEPTEEEIADQRKSLQFIIDENKKLRAAGVTGKELKTEEQRIKVKTMRGKQEAQEKFNAAYESGDDVLAAHLAERMGDPELAKMIRGTGEFNKEIFDSEEKFRTKYENQIKDFTKIQGAYSTLLLINEDPSPASDLATIFAFMKMLDPTSVVREGEFANAQNSGSAEQQLWNNYNQILKGYRLGEVLRDAEGNVVSLGEVRTNFLNTARSIYLSAREGRDRTATNFRKLAASYKQLNPDRVVYDTETDRVFASLTDDKLSEEGRERAKEIRERGHNVGTWSELMNSTEGIGVPFGQEDQYQPPPGTNGQGGAGGDGTSQAETPNPNRKQLSSGRWVVPDGKGGWKDE